MPVTKWEVIITHINKVHAIIYKSLRCNFIELNHINVIYINVI